MFTPVFYLAQFPPEHDLFMDYYLIYIIGFVLLGAIGIGRFYGVDRLVERVKMVKRAP